MPALPHDAVDAVGVQCVGEGGAGRVLDAVRRPEKLLDAPDGDRLAGLMPRVAVGEAHVSAGVPVGGRQDEFEVVHEGIGHGDYLVAVGDGQGASGEEVVLDVDENKRFHGGDPFRGGRLRPARTAVPP